MVPKYSVRRQLSLDSQEFYSKGVLDFIQQQELIRGSGLVQLLKNGKRRVTKKSVKKIHPYSKDFLADFVNKNPKVLSDYKKMVSDLPGAAGAPENSDIEKNFNEAAFSKVLRKNLTLIPTGKDNADSYHKYMIGVLEFLFYPSFLYPEAEQKIHGGRKRIDITYLNGGKSPFFEVSRTSRQCKATSIPVECKNYTEDPKNPEIDQLAGRFSHSRGFLGFLCYRTCKNRKKLLERCRDTAVDGRGFMIPMGDEEISHMLKMIERGERSEVDRWLTNTFQSIS